MKKAKLGVILALVVLGAFFALSPSKEPAPEATGGEGAEKEEFERGPHNGRLLKNDNFAIEITIFEDGVPPQFRVYAYDNGKALDPSKVQLAMEVKRLDGEVNPFNFSPQEKALVANAPVEEPHSFDVTVKAAYEGKSSEWNYASYEGRTTITPEAAATSGIETQEAGSATIREIVTLTGRVALNPNATANVKARLPGVIKEVRKA
ncbi:MAG: HlyD family secretion protein, partial [Rickettsiales bacterium]|nr:HlyD family secretion protein [Rickettsiales bacterium]